MVVALMEKHRGRVIVLLWSALAVTVVFFFSSIAARLMTAGEL